MLDARSAADGGGSPGRVVIRTAFLVVAAAAGTGCRSPWYYQDAKSDVVRTEITLRTEPVGATLAFDGKPLGRAPVTFAIEYDHTIQLWARSGNLGADMREATGPVGTVLLLPVWLVASLVQRRDELRRNVYGGNVHDATAHWPDGHSATRTITLDGEERVDVVLRAE